MGFDRKKFCITGPLNKRTRDDYITFIKNNDGLYSSSVTKDTNYLVTNQDESTTKRRRAESLGTPIINEEQFLKIIKKNKKLNEIAEAMGW